MQDQHSAAPVQPRFTKLDTFDPHRQSFECKHEADVNPPIAAEAEALFQQGMAVTSYDLWPDDRDNEKAAQLWTRAAGWGHWKAQLNLAGLYLQGLGVPQDADKALELTEDLMRKGVPAAWDNMGAYYMGGVGPLKQDATVAYAFWQKAADMGSMAAQAYLGEKLNAGYDDPPSFWGNEKIGLKMLECAFSQGSGSAAYELGQTQNRDAKQREDYSHALGVFHEGVKLGNEKAANSLSVAFDAGRALVDHRIDVARAERYSILGDALWRNPDLRLPNLDKVLPLPPANLPKWDGNKQTLIDAAKALVVQPAAQPTPGSQRTGRAHIPQGHVLQTRARAVIAEANASVPHSGYWQPRLHALHREHEQVWGRVQVPQRYDKGETFETVDRSSMGPYAKVAPRTVWHYMGEAVAMAVAPHPLVAQGIARSTDIPEPLVRCQGSQPCPRTGVWLASIPKDHSFAVRYNRWDRQSYVAHGQAFPDFGDGHLHIEPGTVTWLWLGNANESGFGGVIDVSLGHPGAEGTSA
ncbi:DUF6396 domain-containing protein [Variovorax sp. PAMC26660]|uniref:SEL1-like repeat protein n=1 Tax=Variovorax sp. PAMC26660 TaxID=2762322 RepID=UPI00164E6B66|nr:DUF6396 domain-containing protein [Variovorax sp. PAMC26660]QNK66397.1 sel1 repeat family protein [Variovorax sp. PAMC26660]